MRPHDSLQNEVHCITDFESFLQHRQNIEHDGGTMPWMITFADLMMILLVFSFILFMTHRSTQTAELKNSSLSSIAYATVNQDESDDTVTVRIPMNFSLIGTTDRQDRIIKKLLLETHGSSSLTEYDKRSIDTLADLARKNPGTRIIITGGADTAGASMKTAETVSSYLNRTCGIDKKSIYMQSKSGPAAPSSAKETEPADSAQIEVKLVKPFWWF